MNNDKLPTDSGSALINNFATLSNILLPKTGKKTVTTSGSKATQQTLDDASIKALQKILTSGQYSKDAATSDSQAAIDTLMKRFLEKNMPNVVGANAQAGAYNSTTTKMLMDNLVAQATAEGAALQQKTIKDYADIVANAAQNLKGAKTITKTSPVTQVVKTQEDPLVDPLTAAAGVLGLWGAGKGWNYLFGDDEETKKKKIEAGDIGRNDFGSNGDTQDGGVGSMIDAFFQPIISNTLSNLINPSVAPDITGFKSSISGGNGIVGSIQDPVRTPPNRGLGVSFSPDYIGANWTSPIDCFITTATTKFSGKPDNCYELETLRNFRDTYMQETPERQALIAQYYEEAPAIVEFIDANLSYEQQINVYKTFDSCYIQPAIDAIEAEDNEKALSIYTDLFNLAKSILDEGKKNG